MLHRHRRQRSQVCQSACRACGKLILSEQDPPPEYCPERPLYNADGIVLDDDGRVTMIPGCEPQADPADLMKLSPEDKQKQVKLAEKRLEPRPDYSEFNG